MSDQKIKTAAGKAPLGLIPAGALIGPARVFGYGGRKYEEGNYYRADLSDGAGQRYVSAALRHLAEMQEPNGLHTPESLAALDPESGLPHLDHVLCGLMMLRTIMVKGGALPADPGRGNEPPGQHENCDCRECVRMQTFCALDELESSTELRSERALPHYYANLGKIWAYRGKAPTLFLGRLQWCENEVLGAGEVWYRTRGKVFTTCEPGKLCCWERVDV